MTGIRLPSLVAMALLLQSAIAGAQPASFDMSPERPSGSNQAPPPMKVTPQPGVNEQGRRQEKEMVGNRRFILPFQKLSLGGEYNRRAWNVYVTAEEAVAVNSVTLTYQNAIVVAPEASDLVLLINNRQIGREPVSSPNGNKAMRWDVPAGLLKPGINNFELVVNQRHRTDCDLQSTYELWTEIDGSGTYLDFSRRPDAPGSAIEALRAIGVDHEGITHFDMVIPSLNATHTVASSLRITQALAVISGMPNPRFTFRREVAEDESESGRLIVLVGTTTELATLLPNLPSAAHASPLITFMSIGADRAPAIVIVGPTWPDIQGSLEGFLAPISPDQTAHEKRREFMDTDRWMSPNPTFLFGGETLSFAQLGVQAVEFSGRRYRTGFDVAVPSDFFAGAYGEAIIRLDAAHGNLVIGSSRINVFVNGNFASTVALSGEGGGILKQTPIRLTLRHFRPGTNHIEIEAVTVTKADEACLPDREESSKARFALFDSSSFDMPHFARMGQTPNLAALAGTGFPYSQLQQPASLFLPRVDADMLSAAANFLGKVAQVSGASIAVEPVFATNMIGARDAIFIAEAGQLPSSVLSQLNLDPDLASRWRRAPAAAQPSTAKPALDVWRDRVEDGFVQNSVSRAREWLREKLNIPAGALRLFPEAEAPFIPVEESDLAIVQGRGPGGNGIWTVVTAPTAQGLSLASGELVQQAVWETIWGRASAYTRSTREITGTEVLRPSFRETVAPSLDNYRLVAANWLSSNLVSYAIGLVLVACLLGIATAAILPFVGRKR